MTTYADRPAQVSHDSARFRPVGDQCLILFDHIRDARKEVMLSSGLIVPHSARKPEASEACWATVIAAGPGRYADKFLDRERGTSRIGSGVFIENDVKAGQRVLIQGPLCGDAVVIDGLEHRIVVSDVVVGVEEECR